MKVSIVTINYNNANGLQHTLDSVNGQTYQEYEFVIIDGSSKDGSKEMIERYANAYPATSWVSEPDGGIYNAMNKGVRMASGDYCIFMNSGDCFYDKYSLQNSIMYLDGGHEIVSGAMMQNGHLTQAPKDHELSLAFFIKSSLSHQSTFIRRELLLKHPYNEKRDIVGDHEFFFQALILNSATYQDIPVCISNCEPAGASRDVDKSIDERIMAIKELLPSRMGYDVEFIRKNHNPIIIGLTNIIYKKWLRNIFLKYNQIRLGKGG